MLWLNITILFIQVYSSLRLHTGWSHWATWLKFCRNIYSTHSVFFGVHSRGNRTSPQFEHRSLDET